MKNVVKLLLVTLFAFISCKSSFTRIGDKNANYIPYYLKVYEADSLFLTENYLSSYKILDSLFKKFEPANLNNINEYSTYLACCIMTEKTSDIKKKIEKGILNYGTYACEHPKKELIFDKTLKIIKDYKIQTKELKLEYYKQFNTELRDIIKQLCIEDADIINKKITNIDNIIYLKKKHEVIIDNLIKKYGFPNEKLTGRIKLNEIENADFLVVFLHQTADFKLKHLPILKESLLDGRLSPFEYSSVVDRILLEKNETLYGVIPNVQIKNRKETDSLRKKIGLPKLGYEEWAYYTKFPTLKE